MGGAGGTVSLHTGELILSATDLVVPGRGSAFNFTRKYRSYLNYAGPLGHGRDHNWNARLLRTAKGHVVLYDGSGRRDLFFRHPATGVLHQPRGRFDRLQGRPSHVSRGWCASPLQSMLKPSMLSSN